ncbi:uncharacterized protein V1510DRAFT_421788 [Dipodascopsis tothii]|uniref:uncharacterized protein n=1 Tax=Dipodascopsis tothii TaxID=44089 RepID=UPI0034CDBECF
MLKYTDRFFRRYLSGGNLELFRFGSYVLFPIGIMYLYGSIEDETADLKKHYPEIFQPSKVPLTPEGMAAERARIRVERMQMRKDLEEKYGSVELDDKDR